MITATTKPNAAHGACPKFQFIGEPYENHLSANLGI